MTGKPAIVVGQINFAFDDFPLVRIDCDSLGTSQQKTIIARASSHRHYQLVPCLYRSDSRK